MAENKRSTYNYTWNPKGTSGGTHTISSNATDNYGNSAQTSIDVILEKGGDGGKGGDGNGKGNTKQNGKK